MKAVVVTGGSGALGWTLIRKLRGRCRVVATYNTHPFELENVDACRLDLGKGGDAARLIADAKPDCVVHAASLTKADYCEEHEDEAKRVNIEATEEVAKAAQKAGARLAYVSTDLVFDGAQGQYGETDEAKPLSVYGKTKLKAETVAARCCKDTIVLRSALIYGWGSEWNPTFLDWLCGKLTEGRSASLFSDQNRSPIYIEDVAEALERVMLSGPAGLFHIGGRVSVDRLTFGRRVCEVFGFSEDLLQAASMNDHPYVAPRPRDCSLDSSKFHYAVGLVFCGVQAGLRRALKAREPAGSSGVL